MKKGFCKECQDWMDSITWGGLEMLAKGQMLQRGGCDHHDKEKDQGDDLSPCAGAE